MYNNPLASGTSIHMGVSAERKFDKLSKKYRYQSFPTEKFLQISHVDRKISGREGNFSVEIKAMKKISRSDPSPQDKWIWIELHGVHPQDRGWLYGGKADLIVFEMRYGFLFVKRTDLVKLVDNLVDFKTIVDTPQAAPYKVYARRQSTDFFGGGNDRVTLVEGNKIENIAFMRWKI
jgi:hypothetical protein